jgi:hypothetical protein
MSANDYNPFDEETKPERGEYSRPKDGQSTYVWKGIEYPRVTDILSIAPGNHLMSWYAKVASLRAAAWLVHAGLFTPPVEDPMQAELEKWVDDEAIRIVDPVEAIKMACDWKFNMREAERYRDHAARIGSLGHHWVYNYALGVRISESDRIDWLKAEARNLKLIPKDVIERYEALGKDIDSVETDLAFHAVPHIESWLKWNEVFQPDWIAIGLEAVVINEEESCAGTCDGWAKFHKSAWEKSGMAWPFPNQSALLTGDLKTGSASKTHLMQVAAYSRSSYIALMGDQTEHPIPESEGMFIVYTKGVEQAKFKLYAGREAIDDGYDAFCGINAAYRIMHDLPKCSRIRKLGAQKEKRGDRTCPF